MSFNSKDSVSIFVKNYTTGVQEENTSTEAAVPAMGWVFNDKGEVTLTAYSTFGNQRQRPEQQERNTCKSGITP